MNIFIFIISSVYFATIVQSFLYHRYILRLTTPIESTAENAGQPLFLTPLIDTGDLLLAKQQSLVPPLVDNIESYSGFLTVDRKTKSHIFFWYIPTTNVNLKTAPLILWLNGGPGCSSLFGLFVENGPFEVTKEGVLRRRDIAWTNHYNMLFIDQPVGAGFSFTENEGYVTTERGVAEHLYEALLQFYRVFPELTEHDFYIAGESYAGKYIPAIGYKILVANQLPDQPKIPLKGLMIGNGLSDPENMMEYGDFLHNLGLLDDYEHTQLESMQTRSRNLIRTENWLAAKDQFNQMFDFIYSTPNITNIYDYRSDELPNLEPPFTKFITQDEIRRSIHVGRSPYEACSEKVNEIFKRDFMQSVRPWIEALLHHYPILFYSGQMDIIVAHVLTVNMIRNLHWNGAADYYAATKQVWLVGDVVAGYYKSASNLVYALVRNAGHMVPTDEPKHSLELIDMFVQNKLWYNSTNHKDVANLPEIFKI